MKTPTLFIVGEKDPRVRWPVDRDAPGGQSLGVPTTLYVAPREPHGFVELRHQLTKINVELEWFARWIGKPPHLRETAPDRHPDSAPAR